jgi:pimeloyl-ACP methyl ester carboxylesterase
MKLNLAWNAAEEFDAHKREGRTHLRDAEVGDTVPGELLDVAWEPPVPGQRRVLTSWNDYMGLASRVVGRFHGQFHLKHFDYVHPTQLQPGTPRRLKKPYSASVAYTEWGPADAPVLLCCGGVANVAMRFHYLAADLSSADADPNAEAAAAAETADEAPAAYRVICMDWLGRGRSGWLAAEDDYSLATYAEQLRQLIAHLGVGPVTVLGSSMGGSAAIELIARHPRLVSRLILNDVGPFIPARRRKRRADTIARHYVFRNPAELLRRVGASSKNDGPVSDDIRFNLTFHQTRWSDDEGGRVYRHDTRAMQAYRKAAHKSVSQWVQWQKLKCPVLLIHGMQSDALFAPTIKRMRKGKDLALMHVPDTGHTPLLADRNHIEFMRQWLTGQIEGGSEWSVLHANARAAYPGNPIAFAPKDALR